MQDIVIGEREGLACRAPGGRHSHEPHRSRRAARWDLLPAESHIIHQGRVAFGIVSVCRPTCSIRAWNGGTRCAHRGRSTRPRRQRGVDGPHARRNAYPENKSREPITPTVPTMIAVAVGSSSQNRLSANCRVGWRSEACARADEGRADREVRQWPIANVVKRLGELSASAVADPRRRGDRRHKPAARKRGVWLERSRDDQTAMTQVFAKTGPEIERLVMFIRAKTRTGAPARALGVTVRALKAVSRGSW